MRWVGHVVRGLGRPVVPIGLAVLLAACAGDGDGGAASGTAVRATVAGTAPAASGSAGTDPAGTDPVATDPTVPTTVGAPARRPEGFTTATVRLTTAGGEVCEVCLWLADDGDERGRGLMGVTDLGEPVGMAFVFPEPIEGAFYMFGTPTPLSIAWFGPDGEFVSATDMEPCTSSEGGECPRYRATGAYQLAIEVFRGGLVDLAIGPGTTAEVLTGSESPTCALLAGG